MAYILSKTLQALGLSAFSIKTYLTLTELKEPNVTKLSQELSVDRTKIYTALKELKDTGLIPPKSSYARSIEVFPPKIILQKLREKEIEAKNLSTELIENLPELNFSFYNKSKSSLVKIYEGKTQFLNLYNQVLDEAEDYIYMFGNAEEVYDLISFELQLNWTARRINSDIRTKLLVSYSNRLEKIHKNQGIAGKREVRWLPETYPLKGSYWLFGKKIIHWNPVLPKAIVIEDRIIYETMQTDFNYLWDSFENNIAEV